ncbi:MAG: hypothetical protein O7H41_09315 [Planctomycetota bacterium]|nr:hypothetical protein [Planctomycetota bacterium]
MIVAETMFDQLMDALLEPAIFIAVGGTSLQFGKWLYKRYRDRRGRESRLASTHVIYLDLEIDPGDKVEIACRCFRRNPDSKSLEHWKHQGEPIPFEHMGDNRFSLAKDKIQEMLEKPGDPFKVYCEAPLEKRGTYYDRLCRDGHVVTGRGEPVVGAEDRWRIWFLIGLGQWHEDIQDLLRLNHRL